MTLTIGIPTYHRHFYLFRTIRQILGQQHSALVEVIIVDQTPPEEIAKSVKEEILLLKDRPIVRYYQISPPNLPLARNLIIKTAKGDVIHFFDDDVILASNTIAEIVSFWGNAPGVVHCMAGQIFQRKDGSKLESTGFTNKEKVTYPVYKKEKLRLERKRVVVGCNFSVLKKSAAQISGFDESFTNPALCEDMDFSKRIKKHFGKEAFCFSESVAVIHLKAPGGGTRMKSWEKDYFLSNHIYMFRHTRGMEFMINLYFSLKRGPLKRENIQKFWRQPSCWFYFILSFFKAYRLRDKFRSSLAVTKVFSYPSSSL